MKLGTLWLLADAELPVHVKRTIASEKRKQVSGDLNEVPFEAAGRVDQHDSISLMFGLCRYARDRPLNWPIQLLSLLSFDQYADFLFDPQPENLPSAQILIMRKKSNKELLDSE
jgi:hypothetical protein